MKYDYLSEYKDVLAFVVHLPDQAAPAVVSCLDERLDWLWDKMTPAERQAADEFGFSLVDDMHK